MKNKCDKSLIYSSITLHFIYLNLQNKGVFEASSPDINLQSESWHIYEMAVRAGLWTGVKEASVLHELNESPSNMSGQDADSVNLKVNTRFNLQISQITTLESTLKLISSLKRTYIHSRARWVIRCQPLCSPCCITSWRIPPLFQCHCKVRALCAVIRMRRFLSNAHSQRT